ncbi:MAG: IPTL-CTERM sorting domain-containing protein [Thermodesulfobacteriota bacterium]
MATILSKLNRGILYSLVYLCFIIFLSHSAYAEDLTCLEQDVIPIITNATRATDPSISDDGSLIAFISNGNINNTNSDGSDEVYHYHTETGVITTVTNEPAGINAVDTAISGDSRIIAFSSESGNDGTLNLFMHDVQANTIEQITNHLSGSSRSASANRDGSRISFVSNEDLTGGNIDGNFEIFLYDSSSGIKQITDTVGGICRTTSISADGLTVAFDCTNNINNGNPDLSREIFFYDDLSETITQITDGPNIDTSGRPSVSADGNIIAFSSTGELVGPNTDDMAEIYYYDKSKAEIIRLTNSPLFSDAPSVSPDGKRVAFTSIRDPNGENPENNQELFMHDIESGQTEQVTRSEMGTGRESSISSFGIHIAFLGIGNVTGEHPDLVREIYYARCSPPKDIRNVPTLSEWGLVSTAVILGFAGFYFIRRRKVSAG